MKIGAILRLLTIICTMMAIIALGFAAAHFGIIGDQGRKNISSLVIDLVYPCYVLNSFINNIGLFTGGAMLFIFLLGTLAQGATLLCNHALYRKAPPDKQSVLRYGTVVSNSAFLGVPMVESVFGNAGLICASIFVIPLRINTFGVAVGYFLSQDGEGLGRRLRRILTQPSILATIVGILIMLAEWQPPVLVTSVLSSMAGCSTPLCMMTIGMVIQANAKQIHMDKLTAKFTLARLVLIPAVTFSIFRLCGLDQILVGTAVLLAAMPIGTTVALLADKYGKNAAYAGELVLVTTLCSMLTLPVWSYLCLFWA